jgi:hypothetical protein
MARNVTLQILRGTQANIASAMPLALGEMYFGTDTGNLFFGTPGVGIGYIQLGDTTQVNEKLEQLIVLMECVRRAMVVLACEGTAGRAKEIDFDPATISEELASSSPVGR